MVSPQYHLHEIEKVGLRQASDLDKALEELVEIVRRELFTYDNIFVVRIEQVDAHAVVTIQPIATSCSSGFIFSICFTFSSGVIVGSIMLSSYAI